MAGDSEAEIDGSASAGEQGLRSRLRSLLERELPVTVVFAERSVPLAEIAAYEPGSLISTEETSPARATLFVAGQEIGRGVVVQVAHRLALRIDELRDPREFLPALGAAGSLGVEGVPAGG
ncbi:MAG: FliM/FliN family flagellar motor C-terminal domain-containing protein [Planctomycetes bacterium]|nr:FliM/FliN family flagellar motor C-terminal domain-containing protein [Planctomycetota bacterium]